LNSPVSQRLNWQARECRYPQQSIISYLKNLRRAMSQAVVDPEQLRQFASHLKLFAEELRTRGTMLAAQMNQLEQTWRDEQQRKFSEEFVTQLRGLSRIVQTTEAHVPYLLQKAEQIDAYLGR
jgi:uncharacterized protein YukE